MAVRSSPFRTFAGGVLGLLLGNVLGVLLAETLVGFLGTDGWWARPAGEAGPCRLVATTACAGLVCGAVLGALGAGFRSVAYWGVGILLTGGLCWILAAEVPGTGAILEAIKARPPSGGQDLVVEILAGAVVGAAAGSFFGLGFSAALLTAVGLLIGALVGTVIGGPVALAVASLFGTCLGADMGRLVFNALGGAREK
jgi:hypothetical protein